MDERNPMESTAVESVSTEPVTMATEGTDPTAPNESVPETTAMIYEELYGSDAATEEVVLVDVIESVGSDIVHASLFSGFLVTGTLIGIFILRKIYGT